MAAVFLIGLQIVAAVGAPSASAGELSAELRTLIEGFQAHRRVAIGYLRNGNVDLGVVEIERLHMRWEIDRKTLGVSVDPTLADAIAKVEAAVADSLKAAEAGEQDRSWQLLERAASPLDDWRRANGIRLFSDCIVEIRAAYAALDV
jgi:hypothetical protein